MQFSTLFISALALGSTTIASSEIERRGYSQTQGYSASSACSSFSNAVYGMKSSFPGYSNSITDSCTKSKGLTSSSDASLTVNLQTSLKVQLSGIVSILGGCTKTLTSSTTGIDKILVGSISVLTKKDIVSVVVAIEALTCLFASIKANIIAIALLELVDVKAFLAVEIAAIQAQITAMLAPILALTISLQKSVTLDLSAMICAFSGLQLIAAAITASASACLTIGA